MERQGRETSVAMPVIAPIRQHEQRQGGESTARYKEKMRMGTILARPQLFMKNIARFQCTIGPGAQLSIHGTDDAG
jgi:hypothetical protein